MIKQLLLSLVTGIVFTLFFMQHDVWVKEQIGQWFKQSFEDALQCSMRCTVRHINFFTPSMVLEDVSVCPQKGSDVDGWSWRCKQYKTGFSWWHFFRHATIDMWVAVEGLDGHSTMHGNEPAIDDHIRRLADGAELPVPTFLKSLTFRNACLSLADQDINACVKWNSEAKKINDRFKFHFYITDGFLTLKDRDCFELLRGSFFLDAMEEAGATQYAIRLETRCNAPQLGDEGTCFFSGTWDRNHGRFSLRNSDHSFVIDPIIVTQKKGLEVQTSAQVPLPYLYHMLRGKEPEIPVTGSCLLRIHSILDEPSWFDGYVAFEDIQFEHMPSPIASKISFHKRQSRWNGDIEVRMLSVAAFRGSWYWNEQNAEGGATITNSGSVLFPRISYWSITPYDFLLRLKVDRETMVQGTYHCTVTNGILDTKRHATGDISLEGWHINSSGTLHTNKYSLEGDLAAFPYIKHLYCDDGNGALLLYIDQVVADLPTFESAVQISFIRSLIYRWLQYDLQGEGTLHLRTTLGDEKIAAHMHLRDGTIRLPQTYNFINGFDADLLWDFIQYKLVLRNLLCSLHTGRLWLPRAVARFDHTGTLSSFHLPVTLDHCLLNIKQDLFAMVSGSLLFSKQTEQVPLLQGRLLLDRSQLKENIFSAAVQQRLLQNTRTAFDVGNDHLLCDLVLETKDPVRVDTDFLQANAQVNLTIKKSILEPEVSGYIKLLSGSLKFPYKPLHITKGTISFMPDDLYNPSVELIAKNRIKKYHVTLQVNGSLLNHSVILESTPSLTEEQIVALLLVGSEEDSLNMIMPALIMQNMKNIIFGSNQSVLLERYFKPFIKPLTIHLVPSFTDQTGRGGLRGAIEIDFYDRWRVLIQKNFSLTEDTRFELEYQLSDDVRFRAIRDERRDIAIEAEMKWKF